MTPACALVLALALAAPPTPEGPRELPAAPPAAPRDRSAPWFVAGTAVFVGSSLGLGLLGAGLVLGRDLERSYNAEVDRLNAGAGGPTARDRARLALWEREGHRANALAIAGAVVAGAMAVTGALLLARGVVLRRRAPRAGLAGPGLYLSF